jgi:hypothetical protein
MNKIPVYSTDNNNVKIKKIIDKNVIVSKNSSFGRFIKKISDLVSSTSNSILIKTFM